MSGETAARVALNTVPFLTADVFHRLMISFGSARESLRASAGDLASVEGVSGTMAKQIKSMDHQKIAQKEFEFATNAGARIVTLGEEGYPAPLANVYAPPPVLSIQGQWRTQDEISIAIVGTRAATTYGKLMTEKLTNDLVSAGFTIVSGLARGIDGAAHRSALNAGGRTLAVLGCGLNIYYPPEHRELQKKIPGRGAIISQFSFAAGPGKTLFPQRNRVISGLTMGTLVIEAPDKSGALITAYSALEDNREVFAVPGPISSKKSEGTNKLIKKGHAKLVQTVEDIIEEMPDHVADSIRTRQASLPIEERVELSEEENLLVNILDHETKHIDTIATDVGLPLNKVSAILLSLELKGLVKQIAGKMFVRI